ncbi:hypothetical protein [Nonlabens sp. YIK11]|nr:hypothetical protein [Nonlabens sp. YIK11]
MNYDSWKTESPYELPAIKEQHMCKHCGFVEVENDGDFCDEICEQYYDEL